METFPFTLTKKMIVGESSVKVCREGGKTTADNSQTLCLDDSRREYRK